MRVCPARASAIDWGSCEAGPQGLLEGWTTLVGVSQHTRRLRLGQLVMAVVFDLVLPLPGNVLTVLGVVGTVLTLLAVVIAVIPSRRRDA